MTLSQMQKHTFQLKQQICSSIETGILISLPQNRKVILLKVERYIWTPGRSYKAEQGSSKLLGNANVACDQTVWKAGLHGACSISWVMRQSERVCYPCYPAFSIFIVIPGDTYHILWLLPSAAFFSCALFNLHHHKSCGTGSACFLSLLSALSASYLRSLSDLCRFCFPLGGIPY